MTPSNIEAAADMLLESRRSGVKIQALPDALLPSDDDAAYRIQERVASALGNPCGWKIGLTSEPARSAFQARSPIRGRLFSDHVFVSPCIVDANTYPMRGIEAEVVCVVGKDVPRDIGALSMTQIDAMIDKLLPAIEICDSRFVDCDCAGLRCIIADNANGAALAVLDAPMSMSETELKQLSVCLSIGNAQTVNGSAQAVFEHPYRAIQWLCAHLQSRGERLLPGDLIATGSMTGFAEAAAIDTVEARFQQFGTVRVQFADAPIAKR